MEKKTDLLQPIGGTVTGTYGGIATSRWATLPFGPTNVPAVSEPGDGWFNVGGYGATLPHVPTFNYTGLSLDLAMQVEESPVEFIIELTDERDGTVVTHGPFIVLPGEATVEIPAGVKYWDTRLNQQVALDHDIRYYAFELGGEHDTLGINLTADFLNRKPPFGGSFLTVRVIKSGGRHLIAGAPVVTVYYERPEGQYPGDGVEDLELEQYLTAVPNTVARMVDYDVSLPDPESKPRDSVGMWASEALQIPQGFVLMPKGNPKGSPSVIVEGDVTTGWLNPTYLIRQSDGKWFGETDNVFNRQALPFRFFTNQYRNDFGHTLWVTVLDMPDDYALVREGCGSSNAPSECDGGFYGKRLKKWRVELTPNRWVVFDLADTSQATCEIAYYHYRLTAAYLPSITEKPKEVIQFLKGYMNIPNLFEIAQLAGRAFKISASRPDRRTRVRLPQQTITVGDTVVLDHVVETV